MRCIICEKNEWENVDEFRQIKKGMALCKSCGFVSYPEKHTKKEDVLEHYRTTYRAAPTASNLFTGSRKLHYHAEFLQDVIKDWSEKGKKNPVIADVGAAYGMFLHWWKQLKHPENGSQLFPEADLNGVELTTTYRRNAWHEYGLDLKEDFDESKQYDMITSYKVAEHIYDMDLELKRYHGALKEDGQLYISVPIWHRILYNFGAGTAYDIEYYYHTDHCNVWALSHFKNLLQRCGFKIVKEDHGAYDSTFLCQKIKEGDNLKPVPLPKPEEIKKSLASIKAATDHLLKNEFQKALECYSNFPIAWRGYYETNRVEFDKNGFEWIEENIINKALSVDTQNVEFYYLAADLYMRYAKYEKALAVIKAGLELRPKCASLLSNVGNCYRALATEATNQNKYVEAASFLAQARQVTRYMKDNHPSAFAQCVTWIYNDNASIPMPSESKEN